MYTSKPAQDLVPGEEFVYLHPFKCYFRVDNVTTWLDSHRGYLVQVQTGNYTASHTFNYNEHVLVEVS